MEAAKEQQASGGLLDKILPPRLEDAGLEDCALPPHSIKEAFFKAASAVKSRTTTIFPDDEEEPITPVLDPLPEAPGDAILGVAPEAGSSDALVGADAGKELPGPCAAEKGGVMEEGRDKVVVVGGGCVEGEEERKGGCLGGGLKKKKKKKECDGGDEEEEEEKPILTEGFV